MRYEKERKELAELQSKVSTCTNSLDREILDLKIRHLKFYIETGVKVIDTYLERLEKEKEQQNELNKNN